jgi:putative ABC transport system permease protein
MFMWFTISLRNILKNGRRSLMTILAIALGFGAINLFQGYVHSTYHGLANAAIHGSGLGHLTIFKKGFQTQGKLHPEKYQFNKKEVEDISGMLLQDPAVELVTPRLSVAGIVSNGKNSTIFIGEGLVPADDAVIRGDLTKLPGFSGSFLSDKEPAGVVMGSDLASMLNLKQQDYAVILSNSYSGMANALDAKVIGIYNTGTSATNDKMMLMTYRHAQDLVDYQGAERLVVLLKDGGDGKADALTAENMRARLSKAGYDVEIETWAKLSVFYNQVKNMFDMIFFFIFSIVLVIVVMSVINTMSMTVMERTREIGTLRALGFKQYGVKFLFSTEGMLLGLLGSMFGSFLFFGVYFVIMMTHPTYVPPASSNPVPLRVDLVWPALVRNVIFMLALSMIAAFVPARRSAKMSIVDALGHV